MTLSNAIKKLSAYGEVKVDNTRKHYIDYKGHEISFRPNGVIENNPDITCEKVTRIGEKDYPNQDYSAGSFFDNLTQAINYVERSFEQDLVRLQKDTVLA